MLRFSNTNNTCRNGNDEKKRRKIIETKITVAIRESHQENWLLIM